MCDSFLETPIPPWLLVLEHDIDVAGFRRCSQISLTVALFPSRVLFGTNGRATNPSDLVLPRRAVNDTCGAAIVSTNIATDAAVARGWRTIYVPDIDELSSNERQRRAHLVKVLAVHLFPQAKNIVYGDVKCHTLDGTFPTATFERLTASSTCALHTLIHPVRFMSSLRAEFTATEFHAKERHEKPDVFSDIARLAALYGPTALDQLVPMTDTMCMYFAGTLFVREFACRWARYVLHYSMREQLSFNVALRESRLAAQNCTCAHPAEECVAKDGTAFQSIDVLLATTP